MLKKAYISEKSMDLAKGGLYTFVIPLTATKEMVAKVVSEKFKVDVVSVKTVKIQGKRRLQRSRKGYYWEPAVKKALVQVKKGQKIALFEQVNKEEDVKVTTAETEAKKPVTADRKAVLGKAKQSQTKKEIAVKPVASRNDDKKKTEKPKTAKAKSIAKKKVSK